jgi:hypothetical protein
MTRSRSNQHRKVEQRAPSPPRRSAMRRGVHSRNMDWVGLAMVGGSLAMAVVGIIAVVKLGINFGRRPGKPTRVPRAKGEYQAPEPPEGRYWG